MSQQVGSAVFQKFWILLDKTSEQHVCELLQL